MRAVGHAVGLVTGEEVGFQRQPGGTLASDGVLGLCFELFLESREPGPESVGLDPMGEGRDGVAGELVS